MNEIKIVIPTYCTFIAEIGINHNGNLKNAFQLIKMAKLSGVDIVKFQKRTIDVVYTKEFLSQSRESPWGKTQRDQKEGLEFTKKEYDEIDKYCKDIKIKWMASAWDNESLEFLDKYNCKDAKVASAMITNLNFLENLAKRKRHTFISTGMTSPKDIDKAIEIFKKSSCEFTLMHSVSTYPSNEVDLNLINIPTYKKKYGCKVGYSGHEASISPSIFAASLGADAIERHITLDRSMYGSDQPASLEENGLRTLVSSVRKLPAVIGEERKFIYKDEIPIAKKLRYWENK